jgi:hypothetical protein
MTKTMLAGVLLDYITMNFGNRGTVLLFEKPRENKSDREMKFKLIDKYNELLDRMTVLENAEFDLGIPCDLLLDLLRFERETILNPAVIIQDYKQQTSRNLQYEPSDFYIRIKNKCLMEIVKGIFKIVV